MNLSPASQISWTHQPNDGTRDGFRIYLDGTAPANRVWQGPEDTPTKTVVSISELGGIPLGAHTLTIVAYNAYAETPHTGPLAFTMVDNFILNEPSSGVGIDKNGNTVVWFNSADLRAAFDGATTQQLVNNSFDDLQDLCLMENTIIDPNRSGIINMEGRVLRIASNVFIMGGAAPMGGLLLAYGTIQTRTSAGWSENVYLGHLGVHPGSYVADGEIVNKRLDTAATSRVHTTADFPPTFAARMLRGIALDIGDSQNVVCQNTAFRDYTRLAARVRNGTLALIDCEIGPGLTLPPQARRFGLHGVEYGNSAEEDAYGVLCSSVRGGGRMFLKRCYWFNANKQPMQIANKGQGLIVNCDSVNAFRAVTTTANKHDCQWAYVGSATHRSGAFKVFAPTVVSATGVKTKMHCDPLSEKNGAALGANAVFDQMGDNGLSVAGDGYVASQKADKAYKAVAVPSGEMATWLTVAQKDAQCPTRVGKRPTDRDQLSTDMFAFRAAQAGLTDVDKTAWVYWENDRGHATNRPAWVSGTGYYTTGVFQGLPIIPETLEDHSTAPQTGQARYDHYLAQHNTLVAAYTYAGAYDEAYNNSEVEDTSPDDLSDTTGAEYVTETKGHNPGVDRNIPPASTPSYIGDITVTVTHGEPTVLMLSPATATEARSAETVARMRAYVLGVVVYDSDAQPAWFQKLTRYNRDVRQDIEVFPLPTDQLGLSIATHEVTILFEGLGTETDDFQINKLQLTVEAAA